MSWTLLAPTIIASGAVLIILAERRWPYDPQRLLRRGLVLDLVCYGLLQSYVLALAINALVGWIDHSTGASQHGLVAGWPFAVQIAFFVVTHDLYIYGFHRLQHRVPWLWRLHEAHHSAREVDWIAGSRSHALEILINQTIEFGAMVLLGASPDVILCKGAISAVWGMWIHANVDVHTGWLQGILNGPEQHRWHHAIDFVEPGKNFGTKLAIWDTLFGTTYRPGHKPRGYGLETPFPAGFFAQQLHAFRRR